MKLVSMWLNAVEQLIIGNYLFGEIGEFKICQN